MATVIYDGPAGVVNRDVGAETGEGDLLEPGRRYRVSDVLADRLVASSVHWRRVTRPKAGEEDPGA
jgi:hypothetical protein